MKKIIIPILLLLLISAALLYVPIGNNLILKKHTNGLKNIKLNATYEVLTIDSNCGKLVGNGNGMQYLSAMLIHSDEELKWENNDWEGVFLVHVNETTFDDLINQYRYESSFKNIKKKLLEINKTENYYVLYSFYNAPIESIWNDDLRAH